MPKETAIVNTITRHLDKLGLPWQKKHGTAYGKTGEPDLMVVQHGRAFFFEVKQPGEKATRIQLHRLKKWAAAGAVAAVVMCWEQVRLILEKCDEEYDDG